MRQKLVLITITIALTLCIVQGLPRTHRFKPIVNLKQEKLNATEKPVEARKSALFPKNTKKYVVTESPISRTTSSYSYKYFIAKRPLMLKFAPTSKPFLERNEPKTFQSLMKRVKFVVSTPAPSHNISKENNLRKHHNMKVNKANEKQNIEDNSPQFSLNNTTTEKSSNLEDKSFSNVTKNSNKTEVILIPINIDDLKSNPNMIAEEVKDIVNYLDKKDIHEDKIMTVTTSSPHTSEDNTTEYLFTNPTNRMSTENPQIKSTMEESFEKHNLNKEPHENFFPTESQNPSDDVGDVLYRFPNYDFLKVNKGLSTASSTPNLKNEVTSPTNFIKDVTTESSTLKPAENVTIENISQKSINKKTTDDNTLQLGNTTEKTLAEFIVIPVNEVNSHPNVIADEVEDILNEINNFRLHQNSMTTVSSPPILENEINTKSNLSKPLEEVPTEVLLLQPIKEIKMESSSMQPAIDITTESISQEFGNDKTTNFEVTMTTEKPLTELIIIPVNINESKSRPNLVASEVKDILNGINSFHLDQNNTSTESYSTRFVNEITTESYPFKPLEKVTSVVVPPKPIIEITTVSSTSKLAIDKTTEYYTTKLEDIDTTEKASPEFIIIPVNMNEFKSHPNNIANEVKDILNEMNNFHPQRNNMMTENYTPSLKNEVNTESFPSNTLKEVTTESLPLNPKNQVTAKSPAEHVTTENVSQVTSDINMTTEPPLPEVVFIPINVNELNSHPDVVTDEVQDIINKMKIHSINKDDSTSAISSSQHASDDTTETSSSKPVNIVTTERSKLHSVDEHTTENISSKPAHDVITESLSPKPDNKVNPENLFTKLADKVTTQSPLQITTNATTEIFLSKLESDMTTKSNMTKDEHELTTENTKGETFYIPVNYDDVQSNPVIANEVRDIINYVNKLHPHQDNMKTESSTTNTGLNKTNETESPKHAKDMITEDYPYTSPDVIKPTYIKPKFNENMPTESDSPKVQDNVTTESSSQEVIFVPVDLSELNSNPDLIADDLENILKQVDELENNPHKNSSSKFEDSVSTEKYLPKTVYSEKNYASPKTDDDIKTQVTSQKPYENVTMEKTEKPEYVKQDQNQGLSLSNNSSEPSIVFEPIAAITLNNLGDNFDHNDDDDDDDINVGYIINRRNFWNTIYPTNKENKTNEDIVNEDKRPHKSDDNKKTNSINDDISDVIYVLHPEKEDKKR